ncbi:hypothetical protein LYNGBM3L_56520 [Moorena producens 3L]|uniref:Uncharacterized protein n=1 Tax=Moorena producens 3L TaxID=489825 RepID=F4XZ96_9CYAN|nr:hypothetical protein LYNGBM3L_56520 [Moorena producens 3L]
MAKMGKMGKMKLAEILVIGWNLRNFPDLL